MKDPTGTKHNGVLLKKYTTVAATAVQHNFKYSHANIVLL